MQLKVGDNVIHPVHGVGHIVKIEEKRFSEIGAARLYYKITLPRSTIWVPIEAQATIGLRLVTTKRDLDQYRNLLKSRPVPLNNDDPQRHVELASRLKQGSFRVVCEVVRDLTAWGWQKPLGRTDKAILQKARDSLHKEWATAAGVSIAEATEEVESLLRATRQVSMEVI
jgi:CarD family transcriptional regulator